MHSVGFVMNSVTSKKSPNVYKKLPKNDFPRKMKVFEAFTKIAKNVGNLGKIIIATGFKKLPKVQEIAQSGHTSLLAYDSTSPLKSNIVSITLAKFYLSFTVLQDSSLPE